MTCIVSSRRFVAKLQSATVRLAPQKDGTGFQTFSGTALERFRSLMPLILFRPKISFVKQRLGSFQVSGHRKLRSLFGSVDAGIRDPVEIFREHRCRDTGAGGPGACAQVHAPGRSPGESFREAPSPGLPTRAPNGTVGCLTRLRDRSAGPQRPGESFQGRRRDAVAGRTRCRREDFRVIACRSPRRPQARRVSVFGSGALRFRSHGCPRTCASPGCFQPGGGRRRGART